MQSQQPTVQDRCLSREQILQFQTSVLRRKLDTEAKEASYKPQNPKVSTNVHKKTQSCESETVME